MKPLGMTEFRKKRLTIITAAVIKAMDVDGLNTFGMVFEFFSEKVATTAIMPITSARAWSNNPTVSNAFMPLMVLNPTIALHTLMASCRLFARKNIQAMLTMLKVIKMAKSLGI